MQTRETSEGLERNVHDDETLQWVVRPHAGAKFISNTGSGAIVSILVAALVGGGVWYGVTQLGRPDTQAIGAGVGVFLILTFLVLRSALFVLLFEDIEYAATDERIIRYGGVFGARIDSIPFEGVQDAEFTVSAVENFFGVGTVSLDTGRGYETMSFTHVPSVEEFTREVVQLASEARSAERETVDSYSPGEGIETYEPSDALAETIYDEEELQWVVHPRATVKIGDQLLSAIRSAILTSVFFGFLAFGGTFAATNDETLALAAVAGVVILSLLLIPGGVLAGYAISKYEYAATDRRIIEHTKTLGGRIDSLPLQGVQDAEFRVSAYENLFDVGTVSLDTDRGYETMSFTAVPNPPDFAREISELAASDLAERAVRASDDWEIDDSFPSVEPTADLGKNVHGDERLHWVVKPRKLVRMLGALVRTFFATTVSSVLLGALAGGVAFWLRDRQTAVLVALAVFLVVVGLTVLRMLVKYLLIRTEYALTDDRLLEYSGVFGRELRSIPLAGIQDAEYHVTDLGSLFDVGDVVVDTDRGYERMTLRTVSAPGAVAREITRAATAASVQNDHGTDSESTAAASTDDATDPTDSEDPTGAAPDSGATED